jgi:hypothetical protein
MPPKKKNRPKVTPGQVRGIVREMNQPPHNARKRSRALPPGMRTRTPSQERPKEFGKLSVKKNPQGGVGRRGYVDPEFKAWLLKQRMSPKAKRAVTPTAKPKVQKPLKSRAVTTRAGTKPRLKATGPDVRKRIVGIDLRTLPDLVRRGVISQSEANTIASGVERRAYNIPTQSGSRGPSDTILRRELNLTPMARARLDAEEARLAQEARLSAIKQEEESKRNPRVQNPRTGPKVIPGGRGAETTIIDPEVDKLIKTARENRKAKAAIQREINDELVKEKTRRQKKPLRARTITPRGGMGIAPIMPGGGGLISRIK